MCSSLEQLMIALALFKKKTKRFCCPGGKNEFINWSTSEEKRKRSLQSLLICPDRRKSWTNGCSQPTHSFQSWQHWSTMRWPSSFSSWTCLVLTLTLSWSTPRWGYYASSLSSTLFTLFSVHPQIKSSSSSLQVAISHAFACFLQQNREDWIPFWTQSPFQVSLNCIHQIQCEKLIVSQIAISTQCPYFGFVWPVKYRASWNKRRP